MTLINNFSAKGLDESIEKPLVVEYDSALIQGRNFGGPNSKKWGYQIFSPTGLYLSGGHSV